MGIENITEILIEELAKSKETIKSLKSRILELETLLEKNYCKTEIQKK